MRNQNDESIGFNIKKYRERKKLTQKQLGELLNVSQAMIAQYEKGIRHPKIETLRKIANVLNVKLGDFLEYEQTLVDDSEDGVVDSITKDSDGNLIRRVHTEVHVFPDHSSDSIYDDNIKKLKLLNAIGLSKVNSYISDLVEQEKYLKSKPPTSE